MIRCLKAGRRRIIVADSKTEEVLGFHMIGPRVTELVSLATLAMHNGIDVTGMKKTVSYRHLFRYLS